ncbi:MAG TPA: DNA-formamidopyrimidine glycosylase family protein [Opitutaceae bacterium]
MPELAEVEFIRKRWNPGLGSRITAVRLHPKAGVFRGTEPAQIARQLTGATLLSSEAAAKQMLFRASGEIWLGIHLGMTGELSVQPAGYAPRAADHLVLDQAGQALVFSDFRMFGRVQFTVGPEAPDWWRDIAPPVLSSEFNREAVAAFLRRRARSPIKAVLLMQERFPGVGNWMADEILWRAGIHPRRPAGSLNDTEVAAVHRETRWVADRALKTIGETFVDPPKTWLFPHRWEDGGRCPRTGEALIREEIGGRTTCWSPGRQSLRHTRA